MIYNEIRTLRALGMKESDIAKSAKNYQTYTFTANVGQTTQTLQVPGTAVCMLGVIIEADVNPKGETFTLKLNNEIIAETTSTLNAVATSTAIIPNGYLEFTRRMSGRDILTVDYISSGGNLISITVVYLTSYTSALRNQ